MRAKPIICVPVGVFVAALCAAFLSLRIDEQVRGREEYNSWIPFIIGGVVATSLAIWPLRRVRRAGLRNFLRAVLATLCLAPVPIGGEGGLVPVIVPFCFSPLVLLEAVRLPEVILTFIGLLAISIAVDSALHIRSGAQSSSSAGIAELGASPSGGPAERFGNSGVGGRPPSVS
jgi:hypothetical protein